MPSIKIAGVTRDSAYSPNHIGNDFAIFDATADQLRRRGCDVRIYTEKQFQEMDIEEDIILNMCREWDSIHKLQYLESKKGKLVINSGYGIENCTREIMTRLLQGNNIPYPDTVIVDTNEDVTQALERAGLTSVWIKRGDFHAMHKEDVTYCRHPQETQETLHEYYYRGIKRAVINKHLKGDLVKFYGVSGQPFFYWFYPFDEGYSKYGWEEVNGLSHDLKFSVDYLKEICQKASDVLEVKVYGGDCIVDEDGSVRIIDFNDWPSFAPCRKEASLWIAKGVLASIREWRNR
ncbi:MAG: hypothetical protein NC328_07330 [Muribaculum sp.]|nr:hypothetical protein [Muribaculum sp.]